MTGRLLLIGLLCCLLGCGSEVKESKAPPADVPEELPQVPESTDVPDTAEQPQQGEEVIVGETGLTIKGRTIALPLPLASLEEVLGKPSRSVEIARTIETWDDAGIYTHRDNDSDSVYAITFDFLASGFNYRPENAFKGFVRVGEHELNAAAGPEQLQAAGFTQSKVIKTVWHRNVGQFSVQADTAGSEIEKIAIAAIED